MAKLELLSQNRPGDIGAQQEKSLSCDLAALGERIRQSFGDETFGAKINVKGQVVANRLRRRVADRGDLGTAENADITSQRAQAIAREAHAVRAGEDDPVKGRGSRIESRGSKYPSILDPRSSIFGRMNRNV